MESIIRQKNSTEFSFEIDKNLYSEKAVLAAAYRFTDRSYVFVSPNFDAKLEIHVKFKNPALVNSLQIDILDEFLNELLDQQIRQNIDASCGNLRDLIVRQAFSPIDNIEKEFPIQE